MWEGGDRDRTWKRKSFLLLFDGREEVWSVEDGSNSPHPGLYPSHVGAKRSLAQTLSQRAAITKTGHGNWRARGLKSRWSLQFSAGIESGKWGYKLASEPPPSRRNLSCPPLSLLAVLLLILMPLALFFGCINAIPFITSSNNHFVLPFSSLKYKLGCRSFGAILPVAKISYLINNGVIKMKKKEPSMKTS